MSGRCLFYELDELEAELLWLEERMSFNDLLRISEPKRAVRALTVKGPPLEVDAYQNSLYYGFNFKANPSTTGLRHHGYVKFYKPRRPMALGQVECEVDCPCPDYRYRWAWANKQHGSSRVGPNSLNQAWNQAPRITNPMGRPGLCKHLIAIKRYIEGQTEQDFNVGHGPDAATLLNRLTKKSQKLWLDYEGHRVAAREVERRLARARAARRQGAPLPYEEEPEAEAPEAPPPAPPPAGGPPPPLPTEAPGIGPQPAEGEGLVPPPLPGEEHEGGGEPQEESVDNPAGSKPAPINFMQGKEAIAIVEELLDDETPSGSAAGAGPDLDVPGESPESEVITLLRDIRDQLVDINQGGSMEDPLADLEGEPGEGDELGRGDEDEMASLENDDEFASEDKDVEKLRGA